MRAIIHPNYYARQRRIYRLLCTIEVAEESQAANNEVVDGWAPVPAMAGLACTLANIAGTNTVVGKERRQEAYTAVTEQYQLSFTRLLPDLKLGMRARVLKLMGQAAIEEVYNIVGLDHDSQSSVTRCRCERVSV